MTWNFFFYFFVVNKHSVRQFGMVVLSSTQISAQFFNFLKVVHCLNIWRAQENRIFYICASENLHTNRKRNFKTYLFMSIVIFGAYNFFVSVFPNFFNIIDWQSVKQAVSHGVTHSDDL